jgi:hypothetical protein
VRSGANVPIETSRILWYALAIGSSSFPCHLLKFCCVITNEGICNELTGLYAHKFERSDSLRTEDG